MHKLLIFITGLSAIAFVSSSLFSQVKDKENISPQVKELAEAMNLQKQVEASVETYLTQFAEMTGISQADAKRLEDKLAWRHLEQDFLLIFQETFTETELKDLADFMKSSAGKKYIKSMPQIQVKSLGVIKKRFDQATKDLNL